MPKASSQTHRDTHSKATSIFDEIQLDIEIQDDKQQPINKEIPLESLVPCYTRVLLKKHQNFQKQNGVFLLFLNNKPLNYK